MSIKSFLAVVSVLTSAALAAAYSTEQGSDFLLAAANAFGAETAQARTQTQYRSLLLERGGVGSFVFATGTLEPVTSVAVSGEAYGIVDEIYVDFNQPVRRGEPLALVNPRPLRIAVEVAQAELDVARAVVATQRATIRQKQVALEIARHDHRAAQASSEASRLGADLAAADAQRRVALGQNSSRAETERAVSAHQTALAHQQGVEAQESARAANVEQVAAELQGARSHLENVEAVVRQREAALRQAEHELAAAVIRSPIDGVVLRRGVEVGETTPTTPFTIAHDLREMQLHASVDEAEIGRIRPGQRVEFGVDAYRDRRFEGTVDLIRKQPRTTQPVVTYNVLVNVDNPELLLLPGMTASARFVIADASDVIIAPNAALRFAPPDIAAPPGPHVWVEEAGQLRPIPVELGLTDEARTEIRGDGIVEGLRVVTGIERPREERRTSRTLLGF
jgi:HlyD family secretion protein